MKAQQRMCVSVACEKEVSNWKNKSVVVVSGDEECELGTCLKAKRSGFLNTHTRSQTKT